MAEGVLEITLLGQTVNHYHYDLAKAEKVDEIWQPQVGTVISPNAGTGGPSPIFSDSTVSFAMLLRRIHDEIPALQRLRFVTTRDAALRDSFAWALTNESGHSWVPELCRSSDPNPLRTRLSAQLLFPYFKRQGKKEGTLGEDDGGKIEGGLEEGEGSGPRKEFFGLVGAQLQQSSAFTYVKAV